eukprot:4375999-Amphidinium_carterae.1
MKSAQEECLPPEHLPRVCSDLQVGPSCFMPSVPSVMHTYSYQKKSLTQFVPKNQHHFFKLDVLCCIPAHAGDAGNALADMLRHNTSITHMDLSWNDLGADGGKALLEGFFAYGNKHSIKDL